jgi:hypothetical protein
MVSVFQPLGAIDYRPIARRFVFNLTVGNLQLELYFTIAYDLDGVYLDRQPNPFSVSQGSKTVLQLLRTLRVPARLLQRGGVSRDWHLYSAVTCLTSVTAVVTQKN